SADGKRLFTGSGDNTIKVWDVKTGKQVLSLRGHTGLVTSLAVSSDGKRLFTGSGDNTIKVWDMETGKEALTLRGHTGVVTCMLVSSGARVRAPGGCHVPCVVVRRQAARLGERGQHNQGVGPGDRRGSHLPARAHAFSLEPRAVARRQPALSR